MSPFSERIRNEVLAAFPEWEQFAAEETWKGSAPYFALTVAPENAEDTLPLRISSWDEEVNVSFDYYHAHFDRWSEEPGDSRHQSALQFVRELVEENFAVASWWDGDSCKVCAQIEPGAGTSPPFKVKYSRVRVRSWAGKYDADVGA